MKKSKMTNCAGFWLESVALSRKQYVGPRISKTPSSRGPVSGYSGRKSQIMLRSWPPERQKMKVPCLSNLASTLLSAYDINVIKVVVYDVYLTRTARFLDSRQCRRAHTRWVLVISFKPLMYLPCHGATSLNLYQYRLGNGSRQICARHCPDHGRDSILLVNSDIWDSQCCTDYCIFIQKQASHIHLLKFPIKQTLL